MDRVPADAAFAVNLFRRLEFASDPAGRAGFQRVRRQHQFIGMCALQTFEGAALEAFRPIRDGNRYHSRLAFGATRSVDRQQLWIGLFPAPHAGKNNAGPEYLSVRLPTRNSKIETSIERDADAFFFAPDDVARSLQLIGPNNQRESVRNIERAQSFERGSGPRKVAHITGNCFAAALNRAGLQDTTTRYNPSMVHRAEIR